MQVRAFAARFLSPGTCDSEQLCCELRSRSYHVARRERVNRRLLDRGRVRAVHVCVTKLARPRFPGITRASGDDSGAAFLPWAF